MRLRALRRYNRATEDLLFIEEVEALQRENAFLREQYDAQVKAGHDRLAFDMAVCVETWKGLTK
jgi:endonuclease/exonuclease/phosphatase (EEP) superfamily protein YafD